MIHGHTHGDANHDRQRAQDNDAREVEGQRTDGQGITAARDGAWVYTLSPRHRRRRERMAKPRKLHIDIEPPVEVEIAGRQVAFVGITLLRPHVMIEYNITPPLQTESPFGPHLVILDVTDDTSDELYPTCWHDFQWPWIADGRTTTRLERRPAAEAKRLHIVVRQAEQPTAGRRPWTSSLPPVAELDVELPPHHGLPWSEAHSTR